MKRSDCNISVAISENNCSQNPIPRKCARHDSAINQCRMVKGNGRSAWRQAFRMIKHRGPIFKVDMFVQ
jgi:hypothetical protein